MIYLKTFKLSDNTSTHIYPFNIINGKEPGVFVFNKITVLYGNNGSGKSTILNIIAHKLKLKGRESNPQVAGMWNYFGKFVSECEYTLGEYDDGRRVVELPEDSRYIKSEEILYEIRKIQQESILKESMEVNLIKKMGKHKSKQFLREQGKKQIYRFKFAHEKFSNGQTTTWVLENSIEPNSLCLLDEPEVSLSPQNQVKLAQDINEMARYLGVQFVIATHSPFLLMLLDAKIYNLDTDDYRVEKWSELPNVRYFYDFFKKRRDDF